jgi:tetratricopeptide (TPR) repeat protein/tRNA A-37 threonylcarbamoyl transferase component Bud32/TolB-like protein
VVGDTYRLQRELGGGGMSHVFLAEETRLGRQVVIKVLPPEMGAGVNAERFEREIVLAAKLQHPHIVPLLTAGASGDLLYYVMPFIQGESLRVKLAREGELPVTEAMRILRDVVDALAYAHRNGVVHRDIKPDNVLLSEGHAVVTDFGVAKAVSASTGTRSGSLTSLGVALGTPAYMAPEQAAADPHVDHRADVYAVGALAYEMLCGRPPFTAATPQALLAAHITQTPDPVTRYRPTVAPQLNALVMRCLEKRAADRWQTAAELVPQLDAMATPSGGMAPTGARTLVSSGTEAAIRRAHPGRVALLFGVASVLVLAVVWVLVRRLGLPDWVFYGAATLLAIGLPIMLVTGHHERQRAIARTTAIYTPPAPEGAARWFTWRKALLGGGLAFGGLALIAAAYTTMRLLGIGPVGTLVASGVLKNREPLLLADFENRTADTTLGPSLTEAMRVDLSQSPTVRLVDQQLVRDALQRMERQSTGALGPALAREVAERQGIKGVVTGQIDPVGSGYVLSASLVSAGDGQVLTAVRETAADPGALLGAIDRLSSKLRERIGESLVTIREKPPLEQVTTASLPALRKYSDALRLEEESRAEEGIQLLREAVALDTGFAMAWRKLAVMLGNTGQSVAEQTAAGSKAYALRDRLPELERALATAYYFTFVEYDPVKGTVAYRSALAVDPDNLPSLNNLAGLMMRQRRWVEAESLAVRATRIGRGTVFFRNAIVAQVAQGRFAAAHATLDLAAQRTPGNPAVSALTAELAAAQGDLSTADSQISKLRREQPASPFWQVYVQLSLGTLRGLQGRLGEAERSLQELAAGGEARRAPQDYFNGTFGLAEMAIRYRNRPADALTALSTALARHPLDSIPTLDRPYDDLARLYALAGKPDQARRFLREEESVVPAAIRAGDFSHDLATGYLAEAEGRPRDAIASYRKYYEESGGCGICGLYELAGVYDRTGQADSARIAYEQLVTTPTLNVYVASLSLAPALKRLGELYEAKGNRKKATEYYGRFVDLWKDADPELQPGVKEIRGRLTRLAQEPGA